jgi:hypothetical protein
MFLSSTKRATAVLTATVFTALAVLLVVPSSPSGAAGILTTSTLPPSVRAGVLAAENDGDNVGLAVLDTTTGAYYGSLDADTQFPAESVVKVLIAANLLATGQMTGDTETMAYQMITQSDDADADDLWPGPGVMQWAIDYFHIPDLGSAPDSSGHWGNTHFTARGLVEFLAALKTNGVVGPWLLNAMSHMQSIAADGTDQTFGLPSQTSVGAFKQGWGGDSDNDTNLEQLNSIGLLDNGRYAVALMVQHDSPESFQSLVPVITALAASTAPGGSVVPVPVVAPTTAAAPAPSSAEASSSAAPSSAEASSAEASTMDSSSAAPSTAAAAAAAHSVSSHSVSSTYDDSAAGAGTADQTTRASHGHGSSRITAAADRLPGPIRLLVLGLTALAILALGSFVVLRRRRGEYR